MDISRARIEGPCSITFDGVNIGHTLDGIEFTAERDLAMVKVDRFGDTPLDYVLTGNRIFAKFKLAQPDWAQMNIAIPETSSYDGSGSKDRTDFGADAGYSLRADAKQLVIHPLNRVATDLSDDIVIYKAVSHDNVSLPYKVNEQSVVEVTMMGLVVEDYGTGRRLGHRGPADVS